MYDFYNKPVDKRARKALKNLYSDIPETEGCMENIKKEGGCAAWCCLTPDVRVYTPCGMKPISELKKDGYVYTRRGWKKIIKVAFKQVSERIVVVESRYGRKMRLTQDHLVLVDTFARKAREHPSSPAWVEAGRLIPKKGNDKGHYLVFPKIKLQNGLLPERLDLGQPTIFNAQWHFDVCSGSKESRIYASDTKRGSWLPAFIPFDHDFCWFIGIYLSEGSGTDDYVEINLSINEHDIISKVQAFADRFNLNHSIHPQHGLAVGVRIFSRVLARLMRAMCGEVCDKKKLADWPFESIFKSYEACEALHEGLYDGDGTKRLTSKRKYAFTTTSRELAYQVEMLNNVFEELPSFCEVEQDGKKTVYHLTISTGKYKDYVETADDFRVPISDIYFEQYDGLVYDIEVEDEHEFFTECGIVHNCAHQSPSLFYAEFMHTWSQVEQWNKRKLADLMVRVVETALSNAPTKGCVFWDRATKLCQIHQTRPFNCRVYGQTPVEEFKPRYERLKVLYAEHPNAVIRDQCGLVHSRKPPTKKEMDEWFRELQFIEVQDVGVHPTLLNDDIGGSYRQFHDHILLKTGSVIFLTKISELRLSGTDSEKARFVIQFRADLERDLKLNEPNTTTKS